MNIEAVEAALGASLALADDLAIPMRIQEWIACDSPTGHELSLVLSMRPFIAGHGEAGAAIRHRYSLNVRDTLLPSQGVTSIPIAAEPVEAAMREGKSVLVAALLSRPRIMEIVRSASPALVERFEAAAAQTSLR